MNALFMQFFQHPAFLWVMLAITIPLIIEWLLRRRRRRIPFAAMRYLLDTERPKKIRLQDRILLILRMVIIGLIVFALARPLIRPEDIITVDRKDRTIIMLFDSTYSNAQRLGNMSSFQTAQRMANDVIVGLPEGVEVCIGTIGQTAKTVQDWTNDKSLMREKIDNLAISHGAGAIRDGIAWVVEKVKEKSVGGQMTSEVFIFSDMQIRTWTKGEEDGGASARGMVPRLTETAQVWVCATSGEESENIYVTRFEPVDKVLASGVTTEFEVEVHTKGVSEGYTVPARLTLYVNDTRKLHETLEVPAEGKVFRIDHQIIESGEKVFEVVLEGDGSPLDNERLYLSEVPEAMKILVLDDDANLPPYERRSVFWEYATAPPSAPGRERVSAFTVKTLTWNEAQRENFGDYGVVVLANVRELVPGLVSRLIFYVREGGALIAFAGEAVEPYVYNQGLFNEGKGPLPGEIKEKKETKSSLHPMLTDAGKLEEGTLKYFRQFGGAGTAAEEVKVLAQLKPNGEPVVLARRFGQGTAVLFGIDPSLEWTTLPLDIDWPVLVQELLRAILGDPNRFVNLSVGETFSEPVLISTQHLLLKRPDGQKARLTPEQIEGEDIPRVSYSDTDVQGLYQLDAPAGVLARKRFIVNLNPEESDMAMWSESDFRSEICRGVKWLNPDDPITIIITQSYSLREFAGMILFLVFLLLLTESFLAMRFGLRKG